MQRKYWDRRKGVWKYYRSSFHFKIFVRAWVDGNMIGSCRYSKKRHSPHKRWRARLQGIYPNVEFTIL